MTVQQTNTEVLEAPEIADEYEITLADGIEDEALKEAPSDAVFSITSYGADYPVDTIINRLNSEAFFVPKFQREFVWSQRHASRFIESLLMGLPVPGIFLYKEPTTNKHLVVDGQQRLRSLQFFYSGTFRERKFRLIGVQKKWEGLTYGDLDGSDKLKLDDTVVHATIFQQDEPKHTNRSLYFVFERINSGGIRLSPQEIRNCISSGPFMDLVSACNKLEKWRQCFGAKNTRQKDQELILRFFAMLERSSNYSRPMKDFLNNFASEYNEAAPDQLEKLGEIFRETINMIWQCKGKAAFRPVRAFNAAVFESVMYGLALRIRAGGQPLDQSAVTKAYDDLLKDKVYLRNCTSGTSDEDVVNSRQALAKAAFSGV